MYINYMCVYNIVMTRGLNYFVILDGDKNKKNRRWTVGRDKWDVEKITHTRA